MRARYCSACGAELNYGQIEGKERGRCGRCGRVHYEQLIVGAGALVEVEGRLLLLRRAEEPFKDSWGLPAGHVDADEDPASAAVREAEEETGLRVKSNSLAGVYFFDDHPKGCGIFLVYCCEVMGGKLTETAEARVPTFFSPETVPQNLAGGGHSKAILAWGRRS